jgi:myosin heavy subunit
MNIIGLQKSEQDEIFKLLATILWIGNLVFVEDDAGNAAISDGDGKLSNKKRKRSRYLTILSFF